MSELVEILGARSYSMDIAFHFMLFEKSLKGGGVPEDWIYKAGDRGKARNYKPVSLTT